MPWLQLQVLVLRRHPERSEGPPYFAFAFASVFAVVVVVVLTRNSSIHAVALAVAVHRAITEPHQSALKGQDFTPADRTRHKFSISR
ncbi:hypothetical protein [Granulicella tundricola]|uniref:hypothetical protein n=1 Tax=Granulicella tundricola TaxID=940615 RepID=UPI0012FCED3F|nr:hypothetical protein [Granulicella tundricola]